MKISGVVFNIQKYSVHDGPGIRTVVFLKGCPLRCRWCSNPESQTPQPQLVYNRNKCISLENCVRCLEVCTAGALRRGEDGKADIARETCTECLLCAKACPSLALNVYGETMTVEQVIHKVEEDSAFYSRSGGGLTLGGGEPLHQTGFAIAVLKEARRRRINTAIETCGFCRYEDLEAAAGQLNTMLYDIKSMDPAKHKAFTGVTNELILDNFRRIRRALPELPIWVRTPIVPGFNDTVEEIRAILEHIRDLPNVCFEALDYHRLGKPKYEYLGMEFPMGDAKLQDERIAEIRRFIRSEFPDLRAPSSAVEETPRTAESWR
ncbi:MAG: glycyl-radical enzyme activating protein [Desulfobacterales bacterium]|jgi:pyruvate formate lyase activating enzyme|nr:glycyl-radical enzyme activating protein [Desulfobacterales bacterium]